MKANREQQPMMKKLAGSRGGNGRVLTALLLAASVMANGFMLLQISALKDHIQEQDNALALMQKANEQLKQSQDRKTAGTSPQASPQAASSATAVESIAPHSNCWIKDGNTYKDCALRSRDY